MSAERDNPRGPTSEQLRRRVLAHVEAESVLTGEDQAALGLSTADAERWRHRWDAVPWPPPTDQGVRSAASVDLHHPYRDAATVRTAPSTGKVHPYHAHAGRTASSSTR